MKAIRFTYSNEVNRFISLGQITSLLQACYFRGLELGYDRIICDWYDKVTYPNWDDLGRFKGLLDIPTNDFLPIHVMNRFEKIAIIDMIDISNVEPKFLYNGNTQASHYNYLKKYYEKTNEYPIFNIKKDNKDKYILFHYRESKQKRQLYRNTPIEKFNEMFEDMKYKYGDEKKYYKIGEPSKIDDKFDKVFDYFPQNITKLYKLVNNSDMLICSPSGPLSISLALGVNSLVFSNKEFDKDYDDGKYIWFPKNRLNFVDKK